MHDRKRRSLRKWLASVSAIILGAFLLVGSAFRINGIPFNSQLTTLVLGLLSLASGIAQALLLARDKSERRTTGSGTGCHLANEDK